MYSAFLFEGGNATLKLTALACLVDTVGVAPDNDARLEEALFEGLVFLERLVDRLCRPLRLEELTVSFNPSNFAGVIAATRKDLRTYSGSCGIIFTRSPFLPNNTHKWPSPAYSNNLNQSN